MSRHEPATQELGSLLAQLAQIHGIPLEKGEYFFVKTGLSPYWHRCVDDFIPMVCPACQWSSRHHDLIDWRGEALVRLAEKLKVQRPEHMLLDLEPSNKLTGFPAVHLAACEDYAESPVNWTPSKKEQEMKARILIIEHDEPTRYEIAAILETAGYQCSIARNRFDGLALLKSTDDFELILAGIPNAKENDSLLAEAKERFSDMPVVVITAMKDISIALSAIRKGAYDYLLKPVDPEDLLSAIPRALENRRLKLENGAYQTNLEELVAARTEQLRQVIATLDGSYDVTLEALGNSLDLTQAETANHSKRVTAFTIAIARAMGLSADQIRVIARGAFLHDIGKMAIPDAILRKPGALDPEETAIVREHCLRGYQILQRMPFLSEAAEIVYYHHENYDGSGYPRGLMGHQIPLGARITAVANTLDSITSDRPYRGARPLSVAREEIHRWSGRQFDPQVVVTFLQMPEHTWDDLRKCIHDPR